MARKHMIVKERAVVLKTDELEHYGYVDKVFGGRMCSVVDTKGGKFKLHIRGKFKCNAVGVGSIVLFGERAFSSSKEDCDLLYVYEEREYSSLVGIESLLEMRNGSKAGGGGAGSDGSIVEFSMDAPDVFVGGALGKIGGSGGSEKVGADFGAGSGGGGGGGFSADEWADI